MSDKINRDGSSDRTLPASGENGVLWPKGWCDRGFHVKFEYMEKVPLSQEDVLGYGGSGPVNKTVCKGKALAWKMKRATIEGVDEEIANLKKLRHIHLVQLMGSYTHRSFLGLLLSPVAKCDLKAFMKYLDVFKSTATLFKIRDREHGPEAIHGFEKMGIDITDCPSAVRNAQEWLQQRFLCLGNAMAYLHRNGIKHKDMKPSNILLDQDGLWVTDFGSSTDVSGLTRSETNNGTLTTRKYCAPEVQDLGLGPTRRSFDIFALGCVFLEMFISCTVDETLQAVLVSKLRSTGDGEYRYQDNLSRIRQWAAETATDAIIGGDLSIQQPLLWMILQMLDEEPDNRLTAEATVLKLSHIEGLREPKEIPLHRPCCRPDILTTMNLTATFNIVPDGSGKSAPTQAPEIRRGRVRVSSFSDRAENGSTENTPLPPPKRQDAGNGQNYIASNNKAEGHRFREGTNAANSETFGEQESTDLTPNTATPFHLRPPSSPKSCFEPEVDRTRPAVPPRRSGTMAHTNPHAGSARLPDARDGTGSWSQPCTHRLRVSVLHDIKATASP